MRSQLPVYPFDPQRLIGTVSEVGPSYAKANLPRAAILEGQWLHGHHLGAGEVGQFIVIECGDTGAFGRIISVKLPERERLSVEQELGTTKEAHPIGTIQLLATVALRDGSVTGGLSQYPRLGSKVFAAHPLLVKWLAEAVQRSDDGQGCLALDLASLPSADETRVAITPERLFGRHCAVLGATGGGKSWTLARLIEQAACHHAKVILLDATGEFHTLKKYVRHVHLGHDPTPVALSDEVVMPYSELTEADLFALFKPSGQTQAPKLRAAMKSLKVAKLVGQPLATATGVIVKARRQKAAYDTAYTQHALTIERPEADFDITRLSLQINEECVWPSGGTAGQPDFSVWGNANDSERSYCVTLVTRIEDMLQSKELACVFKPERKPPLSQVLSEFLESKAHRVLRISLKYLPFAHNAREIVANSIGRHLLTRARNGDFRNRPLVVFLDEAHQFLDKSLGDENTKFPLDSFELIAKEGRKFCLNICIATQRPRDIPQGVLSQMGTMLVHRLINEKDREFVEKASGDIDRSAAAFLPMLSPGQAVIIGVDFAIPFTVQVSRPEQEPDSHGPDYQACWKVAPVDTIAEAAATAPVGPTDGKPSRTPRTLGH